MKELNDIKIVILHLAKTDTGIDLDLAKQMYDWVMEEEAKPEPKEEVKDPAMLPIDEPIITNDQPSATTGDDHVDNSEVVPGETQAEQPLTEQPTQE